MNVVRGVLLRLALSGCCVLATIMAGCGGGGDSPSSGGGSTTTPVTGASQGSTPVVPANSPGAADPPPGTVVSSSACQLTYTIPALDRANTGVDPLFDSLWHLGAGGTPPAQSHLHALEAWSLSKGQGAVVAVIDDGIETVHRDLYPNVLIGRSHDYRGGGRFPLPCQLDEDHGTSVAGIIAARDDNALGAAGVAPRVSLIALNALATGFDADIADAMLRESADVQVYHNSWGSPDNGYLNDAPKVWEDAMTRGITTGRGGKGSVYVFASGNGGSIFVPSSSGGNQSFENSNFDGYVNKRGIIAVCATDEFGRAPFYAERGANLLVCGPSGGSLGARLITAPSINDDYRRDFSGTSAAAPMVSGVAALLLAAHPALTWRDVQQILARSARETDSTDPSWQPSALPGKRFSHRYGFGVADAKAALDLAAQWSSIGAAATQRACGPYSRSADLPIADAPELGQPGAPATDRLAIDDCPITQIEFVELTIEIEHPYGADLSIRLKSPAGLVSELADPRRCGADVTADADPCRSRYANWRFGSLRHLDEAANGPWQVELTDHQPGDSGRLRRWALRFWGR